MIKNCDRKNAFTLIELLAVRKRGFTLIELLVVAAIIGVLASVAVLNFNGAQSRSRDARRVSDLTSVKVAIDLYYDANKHYPITNMAERTGPEIWWGGAGNNWPGKVTNDWVPGLAPTYINQLPLDPISGSGRVYLYTTNTTSGSEYKLLTHMPENCEAVSNRDIIDPHRDAGSNVNIIDGTNCWAWAYYSKNGIAW